MTGNLPRLHGVTDDAVLDRYDLADRAAALAQSPSIALHIRAKHLSARRLIAAARTLTAAAGRTGSPVMVNDRVDVALIVAARGVHLPAEGLPTDVVRSMVPRGTWIGRSAHSVTEARAALDAGADYVFLGPIWETGSHPGHPGLGVAAIAAVGAAPMIAIGGITPARVPACLDAGAYGVAAISALWLAPDPAAAAAAMMLLLKTE